jgi:hypothetical protein
LNDQSGTLANAPASGIAAFTPKSSEGLPVSPGWNRVIHLSFETRCRPLHRRRNGQRTIVECAAILPQAASAETARARLETRK